MPIVVTCQNCSQVFQVPDKLAGKTGKCTKCAALLAIPSTPGRSTAVGTHATVEAEPGASDVFQESERVFEFDLMPGEQVVDELLIFHRVLFVFRGGVTKVTLTNARVLYNATRVFSPVYWIALALCPPLIWYYPLRIGKNRHVSLSLRNIDSIEKRYRANWLVFFSSLLGCAVISRMVVLLENSFGHWLLAAGEYLLAIQVLTNFIVFLVVGPLILLCLLKTRIASMLVRSANNVLTVHFGVLDRGVSAERFDAFIQQVNHAKEGLP
jgi:hypothetical protein